MDAEWKKGLYLPQHDALQDLHSYAPQATFLLNIRPAKDWVRSVTHWFGMGGRFLTHFGVDISDPNIERNRELEYIYKNHSQRVRDFVRDHPSHRLIQVDIQDPMAAKLLARELGIRESCWKKVNENKKRKDEMRGMQ